MLLSIFIVIDSNHRSRIAATAIVCDETVSTYEWILEQTKLATNSFQPKMIFTDADPAMQVAIATKYSKTIVRHCAFHIQQNLVKNLKKKLYNKWDNFMADFYALRNSLVVSDFEHCWMELMNNYSEVQKYCDRVLYPTKECWAYAFTKQKFSANTHLTQHVESINRVMKLEVNSKNSLCQLQTGIKFWLKDEIKYTKFQEFRNMNPMAGIPHISNTIFKEIDIIYQKYLTPNSLALQRKQIFESLLYRSLLYNTPHINTSQQLDHRVGFIEDDYEEPQILLNMIKSLSTETFEVLERIRKQEVNSRIAIESDSKRVFYSCGLGFCKKALNIAIANSSNKVLEDILHQFINEQTSKQSNNNAASELSEQGTSQEVDNFKISNPSQHKGRGHPANKRYLSAVENYDNKHVHSNNDINILESGAKKKNKC
ncbi:11254_t:CDS:2 [Dentiscutata erythropus]|uniref:11254_t:CDS:1 n=1 Tax=Dentiscutata erythropus TaxID=1348616 RepID=A0A9N9JJV9_9GLOM|nr:11254_t:CDS:2 [Dentiscutata erythropus]